jgi:hypothetical protein
MSDAFTPRTTSRTVAVPRGHRIYTTTRVVSTEFPLPVVGALLSESNFIAGFTGHYILDVSDNPSPDCKKTVTVTHASIPTGTFTEYEDVPYTFPALYPGGTTWPGGMRQRQRIVRALVTYEYQLTPSSPSDWLADPAIWNFSSLTTGPFEVKSYLQEAASKFFTDDDGTGGQVGDFLNQTFITQDTLNNGITIYAPGSLLYTIGASVPSLSTYDGWITAKTEFMISNTIHEWYAFYMRRKVWVRAQ